MKERFRITPSRLTQYNQQWEGEEERNVFIRYQDLGGKLWPFTNIHTDNNYPVQAKFIIKLKNK